MVKAQTDIISALLVVLIALSLTSTALMWGLPLIQKRQDYTMVARVSNLLGQELPSKITYIANFGGSDVFTIDASGVWFLDENNNMLTFTFFSKVSDKAVGVWVGGKECEPNGFNGQKGILGIDEPCVVCVRSDQYASGYNIIYQIGCRELSSTDNTKRYKIDLNSVYTTNSTTKTISISRGSSSIVDNLIITEVKILL